MFPTSLFFPLLQELFCYETCQHDTNQPILMQIDTVVRGAVAWNGQISG